MRALIVGWGSIARRHARHLRALASDCEVIVWRSGKGTGNGADLDGVPLTCVASAESAFAADPDFAIICNPAPFHVETAQTLAERGLPLLIEKPLSDSFTGIDELQHTCRAKSVPVTVGYVLRFHPMLQALVSHLGKGLIGRVVHARLEVSQYLPTWRPDRDWRQTVSARKDLGGGALLELSHEIDLACWLFGEPATVSACIPPNTLTDLDIEDTAEMLLECQTGAVISIHLSFLGQPKRRRIVVVGDAGTIEIDLVASRGRFWSAKIHRWEEIVTPAGEDMYAAQLRQFIAMTKNGGQPKAGLAEGKRVLEIVAAARQSAAEGRTVRL